MADASVSPAIMWFRDDLRLADNPALAAAVATGAPVLCLYVHDDGGSGMRKLGAAARWWLHGALDDLGKALAARGGRLHIFEGPTQEILDLLVARLAPRGLFWNRRYGQAERALDANIKTSLKVRGIAAESFNGSLLREPWEVATRSGGPFSVFTAYWRAASPGPDLPLPAPETIRAPTLPDGLPWRRLSALALEPATPDWAAGLRQAWTRGENGAQARLADFLETALAGYAAGRDRPDLATTSRLSPYLRFGNISPRQIWHAIEARRHAEPGLAHDCEKFASELGWREFSNHLLFHHSALATTNFRREFDAMPWQSEAPLLRAWQRGRTGYPIVDAGMRELWATGWMHNRVRMIVASFLTKHLMIDWRCGEAWFWDTLVDADAANNAASWQWVAGSGADAAPFFRIFNPVLQGAKFDPAGRYVRKWVRELAPLPDTTIHEPWKDRSGATAYPAPIIDLAEGRQRALSAWKNLRDARGSAPGTTP